MKELTEKYCKFNIDDIIETRIKQATDIIKEYNKKVLDYIANSFSEVKTYTIALKKCFDTSQQVSKLTMKLNHVNSDNTRQTELWQELTHKEDMYKIEVINLIQSFQHELRNSQSCSNSKMNDIEQLLHTLPRMSTPLNQNEGTRISNPQVLDVENSQLKNEFSTSFHNLDPSMGQALLKEVPKLKEFPHFSGEGEYDHMEFIRGIDTIKEDFELPDRLVTFETAFESPKFNSDKDRALPWFCQQKDRFTALYPDMTTEQYSAEDSINILEEVTTRAGIGSIRVNLNSKIYRPWKDSVDRNPKENSNNIKYKSADAIRKFHIFQSTTHLANACPRRGKINEVDIKKEPDVEKDDVIEDNSDDKSSIFSESC
ncbi:hypothetical protein O181_040168 [Austropuccinia psidii MF-1]|uniref:Uncharacterized protein n=1 Tax=Austropuccinia psidii MF-1 TaxID=1389203 RepID=A0A9Q3HCL6_9BASI|nr:hypothetical protein [Austropuccinia psidii MF-1]